MQVPNDITLLNNVFKNSSIKLYLVGGCVRDFLLGISPKDWDLVSELNPDGVINLLKNQPFVKKIIETGKQFGVINVLTKFDQYEIATFRSDGEYSDNRRPDSVTFGNMIDDAKRRDIRFNALYYDIDSGEIIDLVSGIEDLKKGIVRTVGNPNVRFEEDALRRLRSIRFAARLGSNLETTTDKALRNNNSMEGISAERIRDEFLKGIKSAKSVVHFLSLIDRYGMFMWIFPGLNINGFIEEKDLIVVIATLLKNNDSEKVDSVLRKAKYTVENRSGHEVGRIKFLIDFLNLNPENAFEFKKKQNRFSDILSNEEILTFANYNKMDKNLVNAYVKFKPSVNIPELMAQGFKHGALGVKLNRLETVNFKNLL